MKDSIRWKTHTFVRHEITEVSGEIGIKDICEEYFQDLNDMYKQSMKSSWIDVRESLDKADKDIFITFRSKDKANKGRRTQGLAIAAIHDDKANILHLSTLNTVDFEAACKLVSSYLTSNSKIKEVLFSVKHYNITENGETKLKLSEEIKLQLKQSGYKWKSMNNEADGSRSTVFYYRHNVTNPAAD